MEGTIGTIFAICAILLTVSFVAGTVVLVRTLLQVRETARRAEDLARRLEPTVAEAELALREWRQVGQHVSHTAESAQHLAQSFEGVGSKAAQAGKVVLAGTAYLGKSEPRLYGTVIPAGSYIIATEPLGDRLASQILPQDMAVCDQRVGLDYYRLSADKRLLFGGLCNYSGRHPKDITASIQPRMIKLFPQLENAGIDYEWGGNIAITIRRIPQLGRIEGNTYYATGYSGHGLAPTHIAGQILADAICGDAERFDVFKRVKHWKLPGGKWFANPALALGILYYRLKEIL
jgi:glycine/D-amino acid oxidase-like deaminating enzyme